MEFVSFFVYVAKFAVISASFFAVIEVMFCIYYLITKGASGFNITNGTLIDKKFSEPDSYENSTWYKKYKEEAVKIFSGFTWSPYVYWVAKKFEGEHINVGKYHLRKTLSYPQSGENPSLRSKVFFFGGSTIWGWGARDNYTIPSCYARLCNDFSGSSEVVIENHGQLGYVSTQELISLIKCLKQGRIPSQVIFYDGLNDVFSAFQQSIAGIPQNEMNRKAAFEGKGSIIELLISKSNCFKFLLEKNQHSNVMKNPFHESQMKSLADSVVNSYLSNVKLITMLAQEYGFKVDFFWQPTLFSKNIRTTFEGELYQMSLFWKDFHEQVIKNIELCDMLPRNLHNLTRVFEDYSDAVYIDPWHINEDGNQKIAREIYNTLNNEFASPVLFEASQNFNSLVSS